MQVIRLAMLAALCVAVPARAQSIGAPVEVRLSPSFAAGAGVFGVGGTPVPALTGGLSAPALTTPVAPPLALTIAPALIASPVAAAAKPALDLKATALAVTKFASTPLERRTDASSREAGEALMAQVLGAPAAAGGTVEASVAASALSTLLPATAFPLQPSAPDAAKTPGPGVHLLSKPLHRTAELGLVARVLHYAGETGFQVAKAALLWHASGSMSAAVGLFVFETIKLPAMITAQSLGDLGLRYWWAKLKTLRELADVPGVTRVRVLTTGETTFSGILARKTENTGLVFVDSREGLPAAVGDLGAPIPLDGLSGRRVRLSMTHDGAEDAVVWNAPLEDLLAGKPMPAEVAAAWRERLSADKKDKTPLARGLDFSKERALSVSAALDDGEGGFRALGVVAYGRAVRKLIGAGPWDRVRARFGGAPSPRAIPLSDTVVERGGVRVVKGVWRRAWRRLTGALIVR